MPSMRIPGGRFPIVFPNRNVYTKFPFSVIVPSCRNTLRQDGTMTLNGNFVYTFLFGKTIGNLPPGIRIDGIGGQLNVQTVQIDPQPRFRVSIIVNAQNLTNRTNYTGYSGTLTSPFFGQPTAAQGMRRIDMGLSFNF